jgi:hypothetical protein
MPMLKFWQLFNLVYKADSSPPRVKLHLVQQKPRLQLCDNTLDTLATEPDFALFGSFIQPFLSMFMDMIKAKGDDFFALTGEMADQVMCTIADVRCGKVVCLQ